jgi:hypothetical protein
MPVRFTCHHEYSASWFHTLKTGTSLPTACPKPLGLIHSALLCDIAHSVRLPQSCWPSKHLNIFYIALERLFSHIQSSVGLLLTAAALPTNPLRHHVLSLHVPRIHQPSPLHVFVLRRAVSIRSARCRLRYLCGRAERARILILQPSDCEYHCLHGTRSGTQ